jgi:hypothetical protein
LALNDKKPPTVQNPEPAFATRFTVFRDILCVRATEEEHRRLSRLLSELRDHLRLPANTLQHPFHTFRFGKHLDLSNLSQLREEDLNALHPTAPLESISFRFARLGRSGIHWLEQHKELRTLDLRGVPVTDDALDSLAKLPNLKSLDLDRSLVTERGLTRLAVLQSLERLVISNEKDFRPQAHLNPVITVEAIEKLAKQMPRCQIDGRFFPKPEAVQPNAIDSEIDELAPRKRKANSILKAPPATVADPFSEPPPAKPAAPAAPQDDPFSEPRPQPATTKK